ncbi:E3 ubiquitin-protein ligase ari2 [Biomphalaria glabrata]|nr:putative E3 ubiquitin-protein ligase ARI4; partial [Biomphalaria glabrata]
MVYKVSKGGVRSGNTLRGLRSLQSKRYARQACIVGRSSLTTQDIELLVSNTTDDSYISEALTSTDVILSLNKKQRWRLPATVSHMIKAGYFDKDNAMVSILERHKLKRRANCVSFVCNRGLYGHVIPTQKRYFSFNMDKLADEKSSRMIKRAKAEILKKIAKLPKSKEPSSQCENVDAFTISNPHAKEHGPLSSSKPEYRLEVFYPCPRSCSLSFNPKYTDVKLEMNEAGKLEMRSNVRTSKKTQRHRQKLTHKEIDIFDEEVIQNDVENMWEEDIIHDSKIGDSITSFTSRDKVSDSDDDSNFDQGLKVNDNILACLIAQAEKAKKIWGVFPAKRSRKSSKAMPECVKKERPHIIYTQEINENQKLNRIRKSKADYQATEAALHYGKVILCDSEISPEKLKERFGQNFSEADCEPRRFTINITDDIVNTLSTSRSVKLGSGLTSFLVLIQDGFYDVGQSSYKVQFNSLICSDTKRITDSLPFQKMTLEEITSSIISTLLDMKQEGLVKLGNVLQSHETVPRNFLTDKLNMNIEAFFTSEQISKIVIEEKVDSSEELYKLSEDWEKVLFCEICYADVTSSHYESSPGTKLNKCGHVFCDNCWRTHFNTKMKTGAFKLTCPGYDCNVTVGPATLLSLVNVKDLNLYLQRQCEAEIETSLDTKWCPNPSCGRAIRVTPGNKPRQSVFDLVCVCGQSLCFACLGKPHWPAKCEQAEEYARALPSLKPPQDVDSTDLQSPPVEYPVLEIWGKICPACKAFVEKMGGCDFVVCRCGHQFCWSCMKATVQTHNNGTCFPTEQTIKAFTRCLRIKHIEIEAPKYVSLVAEPTPRKQKRSKVSMYQKAQQEKLESAKTLRSLEVKGLVKRMQFATLDDDYFKDEILSACKIDRLSVKEAEPTSLFPHVTRFLNSCVQMKQSLHHVAEYTFVLLQSVPQSLERQRALKLANDLSGYCSFISSVFEAGTSQDPRVAFRRLVDIRTWSGRALDALLVTVDAFRS